MEISACSKCGSKNIQMGGIGDGVLFGIDSWDEVCKKRGYQGAPIIFESEDEYAHFFKGLRDERIDVIITEDRIMKCDW